MSNPTVCAMCLVNGRAEMVKRAIKAFKEQTYTGERWLLSFNDGSGATIGTLRNRAVESIRADIIVHWDSDDWSHPRRIEEQVALLQSSGKECVGYREMLFWDSRECQGRAADGSSVGPPTRVAAAWLYTNRDTRYCLGASLC